MYTKVRGVENEENNGFTNVWWSFTQMAQEEFQQANVRHKRDLLDCNLQNVGHVHYATMALNFPFAKNSKHESCYKRRGHASYFPGK